MRFLPAILLYFLVAPGTSVPAQTFLQDLELVKSIKLLEDEPDDVIRVIEPGSLKYGNVAVTAYRADSVVRFNYTSGGCQQASDSAFISAEDWNVAPGKVAEISIDPKDTLLVKDLGIDLKTFRKDRLFRTKKNYLIFHDKVRGLAVAVRGDVVVTVEIFPPANYHDRLCDFKEVKEFYVSSKWRRYPEAKHSAIDFNYPANVVEVIVSPVGRPDNLFAIETKATDPENDVLNYEYLISGGKIVGRGAAVQWDLSGEKPGDYQITAAVDDGCGICGKYITKTVSLP